MADKQFIQNIVTDDDICPSVKYNKQYQSYRTFNCQEISSSPKKREQTTKNTNYENVST